MDLIVHVKYKQHFYSEYVQSQVGWIHSWTTQQRWEGLALYRHNISKGWMTMSINVHKSELSYPFSYASNISYLQPINTIPKFISNHFLSSILTYIFHHKISDGPLRKNHFRGHCHSYVPIVLSLLGRPVLLTFGLEHRIGCMKIQESHPHHQQRLTRRPSHETGIGLLGPSAGSVWPKQRFARILIIPNHINKSLREMNLVCEVVQQVTHLLCKPEDLCPVLRSHFQKHHMEADLWPHICCGMYTLQHTQTHHTHNIIF